MVKKISHKGLCAYAPAPRPNLRIGVPALCQAEGIQVWCKKYGVINLKASALLSQRSQPTLVCTGDHDIVIFMDHAVAVVLTACAVNTFYLAAVNFST
ncbi:MAG: hypothetical protein IPN29_06995 [Saprospiraceae bacterium]|nr:hypothetical protein [Saprospiraceae bacterium]